MKLLPQILLPALLALLTGCTGRWENDAKNWAKAFGGSPPEGVAVIHSLYWRTKYMPREDGWTFELKLSAERRKLLFENLKLRQPKPEDEGTIDLLKKEQPKWFLPKSSTHYTIWIRAEEGAIPVGAFEDKGSEIVFLVAVGL